ncbi:MAG: DUF4384 domain-containing protein [Treponema sp.]|jgi:hypothetical protein|nr:DUF4384 domain-containing protein [Treponema sp.]
MKNNLTKNRGASALLLLTTIYLCLASASVFANGNKEQQQPKAESRTLISTEPSVKPTWVDVVPKTDTEIFFIGTSLAFSTPANARDNARENARIQVLEYYGQVIEKQAISLSAVVGSVRDTLAPYVVSEEEIKSFAQNVVSEVATKEYYTEKYLNSNNKEEYIVYTLHQINRQKAESEISNYSKNISERYTAAFSQWKTLKAALEGYTLVVKSLERNPLHRIMAYYETPKGKAGLYEYAKVQINELASSVNIEPIPTRSIQETETLTTLIKINSSIIKSTGLLDCRAILFGVGKDGIPYFFNSSSDNPYKMENNNNNNIKPGTYNMSVEILLSDLTGGIANNITSNFTFSVTQLNILYTTQDALEAGIKKAVDSLASELKSQTETVIGSFTLTGTNVPSELSLFLTEKITHYAKNNQGRKFKIVEGENKNKAVISGFFRKLNDRVNVTLELSTPDKETDGSQIFSIALSVLEQIPIAVEPENLDKMFVPEETNPSLGSINIEAKFNSNTLTFKHGDNLKLTVSATRDCYFKIIHIDVENKFQMIYPRNKNDNNSLKANSSRKIFDDDKNRRVLCGPYGAETLIIVASPVQFPDIEKEYNQPWKTATEETIKKVISGSGEARYTITILKPHEEYEFSKPQNMTELYQGLRDDAKKQRGYFEGNATSGYYIINNIRGSYLVSSASPDKIQFTTYYLDTYNGVSSRGKTTRGTPFNFSFTKPQNIKDAIETVRSGIESKGGTFNGDEQKGDFKASGIAGQYLVSDLVNVTISEKPFVVPNSLIANEVKNFFGVK